MCSFYPRGASYARLLDVVVCLCVCLSVTCRYCIKTAKHRIMQTWPRDSPETLVFWRQHSLVGDPLPPEICAQSDPPPFEHYDFDRYLLIAPQLQELAKKVQLALIGNRPCVFQRAIYLPCTLPLSSAKGGTKLDFAIFASKIQLLSKEVCYKVSTRLQLAANDLTGWRGGRPYYGAGMKSCCKMSFWTSYSSYIL